MSRTLGSLGALIASRLLSGAESRRSPSAKSKAAKAVQSAIEFLLRGDSMPAASIQGSVAVNKWEERMTNRMYKRNALNADGRPVDKSYLERGLPERLRASVDKMQETWDRLEAGEEYYHWDCDFADLQNDINVAEVEGMISSEQAWYLREKYLGMERV